jgi:Flp pilus assembly protein TadG
MSPQTRSPSPPSPRATETRRRLTGLAGEGGQALAEFAIVLPVLMLLVLGILKGGILYNNYLQLTDAVRSGARQFAIERGQADPCGDAAAQVTAAAGGLDTSNIAMTMTANPPSTTYQTPPVTGTCPDLVSGNSVTLSASYPCELSIMGINFVPGCKLTVRATERVE